MDDLSLVLAAVAGVGLGFAQVRLTKRLIQKPKIWLAVAKLPLWALPMLAAAYFSVAMLLSLTAGASATYLGYAAFGYLRLRKGSEE